MYRPGFVERVKRFVENGGCFATTFLSGIVDEHNHVLRGGWPGAGMKELLGIWAEEIDYIYDDEKNALLVDKDSPLGFAGTWEIKDICDQIRVEGADVCAV